MIKPIAIALLLLLTMPSHAICLIEPLSKQIDEASTVFVATLIEATIVGPIDHLKNGEPYRINFRYEVRERVKGNPDRITSLYITKLYHDPQARVQMDMAEELTLSVGDNVLVIATDQEEVALQNCQIRSWNAPNTHDRKILESARVIVAQLSH